MSPKSKSNGSILFPNRTIRYLMPNLWSKIFSKGQSMISADSMESWKRNKSRNQPSSSIMTGMSTTKSFGKSKTPRLLSKATGTEEYPTAYQHSISREVKVHSYRTSIMAFQFMTTASSRSKTVHTIMEA